jgi:uncharacterized protein (TIGR00159 family)
VTWLTSWYYDSPFSTATLVDWIDIFLLAWLIYRGLLLIRGTRAMQSLLGLAIIGVIYMVSEYLGFATLHWILDNLFLYVILVLIILFQEDIRRALARAGGILFSPVTAVRSDANLLQEVTKAVFTLAPRKVGALIAIERTASLEAYVSGAHQIQAHVSAALLQSIFHPTSPIHDGAVVISRQTIVAAGVFLPISLSKEISRRYGTRHRAAIGLTEATDAICLVVSEERGTVAVVMHGVITPVADRDELRARLMEGLERGTLSEAHAGAAK